MDSIIEKVIYVLSTVAVSLVTYFMGRKKQEADTDSTTLENLDRSLLIYQRMINDMSDKIELLTKKIDDLETMVDSLMKENKQLKSKIK